MVEKGYIVVIDDDVDFLKLFKKLLIEYLGFDENEILTFTGYNEEALSKIKIDLVFLDIELEDKLNGIDICKILKFWDEEIVVIYCTDFDKYMKESWKTSALYYIDKNDLVMDLKETRSKLLKNNFRKMTYIDFFGKKVNIKKVMFVESADRKIKLHYLGGGEIIIPKILKEGMEELGKYSFVQSHKSFAVNTDFIFHLTNNSVVLRDNTPIPLGRKYKKQIENIFRGNA